jgi:hypothetical protein
VRTIRNGRPSLDLKGKRTGTITFISPTEERKFGQVVWKTICDCGRVHFVGAGRFRGHIRCVCQRKPPKEKKGIWSWDKIVQRHSHLIGKKFGNLTLIKVLPEKIRQSYAWEMKCDCGEVIKAHPPTVKSGFRRSCGCNYIARWENVETDPFNRVLGSYKAGARARGFTWNLSDEHAISIMLQNCAYCGIEPTLDRVGAIRNGIDRVDNSVGYEPDNVNPCCSKCNKMKLDLHMRDFVEHVRKVAQFLPAA